MKKGRLPAVLALVLTVALLASCKTISISSDYRDEDYTRVALIVMEKAEGDALVNLFTSLNEGTETMVPYEYSFLQTYRNRIPGLDMLLSEWANMIDEYLIPNYDVFQPFISELFSSVQDVDGRRLLAEAPGSISDFYRERCQAAMIEDSIGFLADLDVSFWDRIVVQYNAWVNARALLVDEENPVITGDFTREHILAMVADHIVDLFFDYFTLYETLFRTTPDPDMESMVSEILGLE